MLSRRQLGLVAITCLAASACADKATVVYIVRHAEKDDPNKMGDPKAAKDPELSVAGFARATALPAVLAKSLGGAKLSAVFSTPFKRTEQTVAPSAKANGVAVTTLLATDVVGLVAKLKALPKGSAALVAGHSNTVPMIIAALGIGEKITIGHDDYGDLYVVTLAQPPTLARQRFGG